MTMETPTRGVFMIHKIILSFLVIFSVFILGYSGKSHINTKKINYSCNKDYALRIAKESLKDKLFIEELNYDIYKTEKYFIISGDYISPTPGFIPNIYVDLESCSIVKTIWK